MREILSERGRDLTSPQITRGSRQARDQTRACEKCARVLGWRGYEMVGVWERCWGMGQVDMDVKTGTCTWVGVVKKKTISLSLLKNDSVSVNIDIL